MISIDDMLRQTEFELKKDHSDELGEERQARHALENAKNHLEQVKTAKYANGQPKYDWSDRTAAQDSFRAAFDAHRIASNDAARQRRLDGMAAEKKTRDNARAAEEAKQQKAVEAKLREQYLADWKATGGSEDSFNSSWPSIRDEHYKRQVFERQAAGRVEMLNRYGGRF